MKPKSSSSAALPAQPPSRPAAKKPATATPQAKASAAAPSRAKAACRVVASPMPPKGRGWARVLGACRHTACGLAWAWRHEAAFAQETVLLALSAVLAWALPLSALQRCAGIGAGLLVLLAELLNSALEQVADELFPGYHPRAKVIKDLGSAAVGLALLVLALTWIALLLTARTALLA